ERISAQHRWAGLILMDGARLQATAARLGEWDFELTLLRQALADEGSVLSAFSSSGEAASSERPVIARNARDLAALEQNLIAGSAGFRDGWPARYIFPLIEQVGFARLARGPADPWWLSMGAILLAALSVPVAGFGWFTSALALLVFSGPLASVARR